MKLKKSFLLILSILLMPQLTYSLHINVGKANFKKSVAAVLPTAFLGTPNLSKQYFRYEKELNDIIRKDLTISSYFTLQSEKSYIESTQRGLRPNTVEKNGFSFGSWQEIGTEYLVKTGFNVIKDKITLEAFVYDVAKKTLVMGRSYSAPINDIRSLAHKFCMDLVQKMTGKKPFFLTKIAATRSVRNRMKEIFIMDWDGANLQQLTRHQSISMSPSWSRDGRHLAYTAQMYRRKLKRRNWDLFMYDFKTKKKAILAAAIGINSTATFFPDLSHAIVRIGPSSSTSDLYKVNLVTKKRSVVVKGPRGAMNVEPALSPDGKYLAFSSDRSGQAMVYIKNLRTGKERRLTYSGRYNSSPAWSPDGKKIAYAAFTKGHFDIFVVDIDGKNQVRISSARKKNGRPANNEDPSFSPDGRLILFRSDRTGNYQLFAATTNASDEYRLTYDNYNYERPKWSPYLQ